MSDFELVLFSVDPELVRRAVSAGVDSLIVDWEHLDKEARQRGADTEINRHTAQDLRRVRAATDAHVLCRVNALGPGSANEIETAIAAGADEVLLPMVRTPAQVEEALALAARRCRVGILLETAAALENAGELAQLPLSRVYVGLNDLAIERRSPSIFEPLVDGTLERLRPLFRVPFGFGGLTLPDRGAPVPCRLLLGEMARLECSFSFLRRSFHRDIRDRDLRVEVQRLRRAIATSAARSEEAVARDRAELERLVGGWEGRLAGAV
jgi:HpcH/HpaI aldolase/citrate lyase family protein